METIENTSPRLFCFVLMPFSSEFDDFYNYGIKESCKAAGAYCERVDEQIYQDTILSRIYNQISKADVIIADMTGRNPNVFYEVGYAHALNKPTILLTQTGEDIPFDLKHFPHIIYEKKIGIIREHLTKRILWFKENESQVTSSYKNDIRLYVDDQLLGYKEEVIHTYRFQEAPNFEFTIHNSSSSCLQPGEFQIGIITERYHNVRNPSGTQTTRMPDGKFLHMLPFYDLVFPEGYTSSTVVIHENSEESLKLPEKFSITMRIFTASGFRDFPLTLIRGVRED